MNQTKHCWQNYVDCENFPRLDVSTIVAIMWSNGGRYAGRIPDWAIEPAGNEDHSGLIRVLQTTSAFWPRARTLLPAASSGLPTAPCARAAGTSDGMSSEVRPPYPN